MIKDTLETSSNAVNADNALAGESIIYIPAGKLDADQYMVSDLDGVTESLFGSGNMNFLMMQSAQTNQIAATRAGADIFGDTDFPLSILSAQSGLRAVAESGSSGFSNSQARANTETISPIDFGNVEVSSHSVAATSLSSTSISSAPGNLSSGSVSTAQNISTGGPASPPPPPATPVNGTNGTDGIGGNNGSNGSNGSPGSNGHNGSNGSNGTDGTGGPGDTIINDVTEIVENVTNVTLPNITNIVENITNNTTDLLTTITNNVFNTVNNILDGGPNLFPIGLDLLLQLDKITNINLDIFSNNVVINILHETLDTTIVTNITDILGDITTILGVNLLIFPLTPDTDPNDKDITVIGDLHLPFLPPLDLSIPLDPVEALLGDIDLNLDLTNELVGSLLGGLFAGDGADTDLGINTGIAILDNTLLNDGVNVLLNPVENLLGDIDLGINLGLDLFGNNETNNAAGDTDIVLPIALDITNSDVLNNVLNIDLDPIEAIVGDIDLDITAAIDLLGAAADNLLDAENGGNNDGGLLSFLGDTAASLVSPLFPENTGTDNDLGLDLATSLLDVPLAGNVLDLTLNPVEDLIGDFDISLSPVLDVLGGGHDSNIDLLSIVDIDFIDSPLADGLLDQGLTLEHLPLANLDLPLLAGADLLGNIAPSLVDNGEGGSAHETLLSSIGDTVSTTVENLLDIHDNNLLGDAICTIDETIDTALGLLDCAPDTGNLIDLSVLDNAANGVSDLLWTENTLPDATDILGGGLTGTLGSIIPDPVGILPDLAATTHNLLGGEKLFGGLFG